MKDNRGWYNEPGRHSLAARGFKTTEPKDIPVIKSNDAYQPRIDDFIEGHTWIEHPNWTCILEEKDIHLGLYIEGIDFREVGADPEDYDPEYPVMADVSIMVVPEETHPDYMREVQDSIGDPDAEPTAMDMKFYSGGVPATHFIEGVKSAAKSNVPSRVLTDKYGHESRWFKSMDDVQQYAEDVYANNAHAVFGLIGFLLDQRINYAGNDGWDVIRFQKNNEEYIGKW